MIERTKNILGSKSEEAKKRSLSSLLELKSFMLQGNVINLAIAVVIGAAFGAVVSAIVTDLITPLIAAIGGLPDFSQLSFTINNSTFNYGHLVNQVLSFIIVAVVIFFIVVKPLKGLVSKHMADVATKYCPECLSEIPALAKRCSYCTSPVEPETNHK